MDVQKRLSGLKDTYPELEEEEEEEVEDGDGDDMDDEEKNDKLTKKKT